MKFKEYTFLHSLHDPLHGKIFKTLEEKTTEIENEGGKVLIFSHSITSTVSAQDKNSDIFKGSLIIAYQEKPDQAS